MWHCNGNYEAKIENLYLYDDSIKTYDKDVETRFLKYEELGDKQKKTIDAISDFVGLAPGAVSYYATDKAPDGWLLCDGSLVSQKTYSRLFEAIKHNYSTKDEEGKLEKSEEFKLPDFRGVFFKCINKNWGNKQTMENDEIKQHNHPYIIDTKKHSHVTNKQGNHSHRIPTKNSDWDGCCGEDEEPSWGKGDNGSFNEYWNTNGPNSENTHTHNVSLAGEHTHTVNINSVGTHETRPKNKPLVAYIKY